MDINGKIICPRCKTEEETKKLEQETTAYFEKLAAEKKYNTFFDESIFEDATILNARFKNYKTVCKEEKRNKDKVLFCLEGYKQGNQFNLILQGRPGTGKSHLAYSTLFELNEIHKYSCLFISVKSMLRKIKASFNNKESKFTEEYFSRLLSSVDYLCLDDLGAETGSVNSDKHATDFVQSVLYGVADSRQNKSTIVTTNLDGKTLTNMYDSKLVSRLMKNRDVVIFKESKDKRIGNLEF
jgi:DNA replication protein DnaC